MTSRREFLLTSAAAATLAAADMPNLGLIFPPAGRGVPEEGLTMYPKRVNYLTEALGLETMTPEGYDKVLEIGRAHV